MVEHLSNIKVGLVDDHQIVLEGIRLLMDTEEDITCVFTASTSQDALYKLNQVKTDVLLLDIGLQDTNGITFCQMLSERFPQVRVIALTMHNELSVIRRMIQAGAVGYLLKNASQEELLSAIRRVYEGKSYYSPEIAESLIRGKAPRLSPASILPSLSSREKQIVRLLMEENTSAQIAEKLHISFNTVETHRRNIMHKLNTRNTAGIIRIAMDNGLLES